MAQITNELLYEVLKKLQSDIAELKPMRHEMRDGFATMKSYSE
ncbi:MAG TPA: hypothetical protein PK513_06790 [Alphaproteobacteria bacterium]|nr:hypothetical protein [Alphaproteobacteria bacterium]